MSEDDETLIDQDEPQAEYVKSEVEGISQGRQSKVDVLEFPSAGRDATLVVWKRMGVDKGLTTEEAQKLHGRLRTYRRSLRNSGWNIPKLFQTRVLETHDESQVVSFESYIPGGDGEHLVGDGAQPNFKKWYLFRAAVETLAEYDPRTLTRETVAGKRVQRLPHGLDLKLANLVTSPDNIPYFVDLFGPKELDDSGQWLTYMPKLESIDPEALKAVCATREGAILRLYRLAEKTWVESGSMSEHELRSALPQVLLQSGMPSDETGFIVDEVRRNYPWLDKLYHEHQV